MSRMDELTNGIRRWAVERELQNADPIKQVVKLGEENGELCEGILKNKEQQTIDSIGDMYVVLVILSMQLGVTIESCVELAYREIKDRKGKTIDGVFVKETDL